MNIGVDLDNTIVCYNGLFHRVAVDRGWIPRGLASDKQSVRDYLRGEDRNDDWTILQGMVYGAEMIHAKPFFGVTEFFDGAVQRNWQLSIVSHRTRKPYLGPETDLHEAARNWLATNGVTNGPTGISESQLFFEETLEDKLDRIKRLKCRLFIDDLQEVLLHESFPGGVRRVCFDPQRRCTSHYLERVSDWSELADLIAEGQA